MRNLRKERIGIVTSSKMDKSIVVMVERERSILSMGSLLRKVLHLLHTMKKMSVLKVIQLKLWKLDH